MNDAAKEASTLRVARRLLAMGSEGELRAMILSLLLLLLGSGVALLQPWPVKMVFDSVIGNNPAPLGMGKLTLLGILCAASLLIQVFSALLGIWSTRILVSIGLRMVNRLRCCLFDHVQRLSMRHHDSTPVGDSVYRVAWDAYAVQAIFNSGLVPAITSIFTLTVIVAVMATRDWLLVAVAIGVGIPIWILVRSMDRPMGKRSAELHESESELSSGVWQTLGGIRAVAAFAREVLENARFKEKAQKSLRANARLTQMQTFSQMLVGLLVAAAMALMLLIGAYRVLQGKMTAGDVVLIIAYAAMILRPLETLAYTAATIQSAVARGRRVFKILDTTSDLKDEVSAIHLDRRARGAIEFENVSFAYRDKEIVLSDVDLKIDPGETIAIVGPSGAGKTTMASLLMRFYDVTSGRILLDDRDLRGLTLPSLRRNVALVMQDPVLFGGTIRENIAYGREGATLEEIEQSARAAGADEFISALPDGYETKIGERGVTLSGGQRQRLAIARAFLKDAPILIMDEPTSALDAQSEADLLEAMERLGNGRTTIIIAHRLSTIRNANRIVVMNDGRIAEVGTHDELIARNGIYCQLHQAQLGTSAEAL